MTGIFPAFAIARRELDIFLGWMFGPKGWRGLPEMATFRPDLSFDQFEVIEASWDDFEMGGKISRFDSTVNILYINVRLDYEKIVTCDHTLSSPDDSKARAN